MEVALPGPQPRRSAAPSDGPLAAVADMTAVRRRRLRLTQRQLAALADVGERSVQHIEAGKTSIQLNVLVRVLEALGLTLVVTSRSQSGELERAGIAAVVRPSPRPADISSVLPDEPARQDVTP